MENIPCDAIVQLRAYPSTRILSFELLPCALRIFTALIGYLISPLLLVRLTAIAASTTILEKNSESLKLQRKKMHYHSRLFIDSQLD